MEREILFPVVNDGNGIWRPYAETPEAARWTSVFIVSDGTNVRFVSGTSGSGGTIVAELYLVKIG